MDLELGLDFEVSLDPEADEIPKETGSRSGTLLYGKWLQIGNAFHGRTGSQGGN